jgi:VanZ family protein
MPTLVAALTLAALLKMAQVEMPRWHLAFWYAVLVSLALQAFLPLADVLLNGAASFLAAWLYFELLDRTDNRAQRELHWLILISGFCGLLGSRFLVDIRVYGVTF